MLFGRTSEHASPRQYFVPYWDERLYQALMVSGRSSPAHHFACVLDRRSFTLEPAMGFRPIYEFGGTYRLWINETEFSEIGLNVSFDAAHDHYDKEVNAYAIGLARFSSMGHDGRPRPAMTVTLRDKDGLSESLARLFFEVKAMSGAGLSFSWSVDLQAIAGASAGQIWGDWENRSWTGDPDSPPPSIGLNAFSLESATFRGAPD